VRKTKKAAGFLSKIHHAFLNENCAGCAIPKSHLAGHKNVNEIGPRVTKIKKNIYFLSKISLQFLVTRRLFNG
jgi:hypothetical protein